MPITVSCSTLKISHAVTTAPTMALVQPTLVERAATTVCSGVIGIARIGLDTASAAFNSTRPLDTNQVVDAFIVIITWPLRE